MSTTNEDVVRTNVPGRMDRLPWCKWHWMIIIGLGTVWILDGLEVTIVADIVTALTKKGSGLDLTTFQASWSAGVYIMGCCVGAIFFGRLTDLKGRKKLFLVTLGVYLIGTVLTAFSTNVVWYFVCRAITGSGIGGEYAAINSAIDELIPARVRGTVDLAINATYWVGALFGAFVAIPLLNPQLVPLWLGWRLSFGLGATFGLVILLVRRNVPESPRWLFMHGRAEEAEELVAGIEKQVEKHTGKTLEPVDEYISVKNAKHITLGDIMHAMVAKYPKRSVLGLALFIGQAFLFNAVFFTYALVIDKFFHIPPDHVPWYMAAIAIGNFIGPILLGPLFDSIGRKVMISTSYILSGVLLCVAGALFSRGVLDATTLTASFCVVFFVASAGASSAYLTVSEIFPMETRALAIAFYYAIGTAIGGISGPVVFGKLIGNAKQVTPADFHRLAWGLYAGAILMALGGIVEIFLGVEAARQSLEGIAPPLSEIEEGAASAQPAGT